LAFNDGEIQIKNEEDSEDYYEEYFSEESDSENLEEEY
jgi:hypothetical protein